MSLCSTSKNKSGEQAGGTANSRQVAPPTYQMAKSHPSKTQTATANDVSVTKQTQSEKFSNKKIVNTATQSKHSPEHNPRRDTQSTAGEGKCCSETEAAATPPPSGYKSFSEMFLSKFGDLI